MLRTFAILLAALAPALVAAQETPDALVKRTTDEVLAIIKADKESRKAAPSKREK